MKKIILIFIITVIIKTFLSFSFIVDDSANYLYNAATLESIAPIHAFFVIFLYPFMHLPFNLNIKILIIKIVLIFINTTTLLPLYWFLKRFLNEFEALSLAFIFQFFPPLMFGNTIMRESLLHPIVIWATYFITIKKHFVAFILAALAAILKITSAPFALAVIVYTLVKEKSNIKYLFFSFVLILIISYLILYYTLDLSIKIELFINFIKFLFYTLIYASIVSVGFSIIKENNLQKIFILVMIFSIPYVYIAIAGMGLIESDGYFGRYMEAFFIPLYMLSLPTKPSNNNYFLYTISLFLAALFFSPAFTSNPTSLFFMFFNSIRGILLVLPIYIIAIKSKDYLFFRFIQSLIIILMFFNLNGITTNFGYNEKIIEIENYGFYLFKLLKIEGFEPIRINISLIDLPSHPDFGTIYAPIYLNNFYGFFKFHLETDKNISISNPCVWSNLNLKINNEIITLKPLETINISSFNGNKKIDIYFIPPILCDPFIGSSLLVGPSIKPI